MRDSASKPFNTSTPMTQIFAIYDNKAQAFMQPFYATNVGLALRIFADNVANPESIMHKHPNDFVIYQVGSFDDQTGEMINNEQNVNLGMAIDFHPDSQLEAVK